MDEAPIRFCSCGRENCVPPYHLRPGTSPRLYAEAVEALVTAGVPLHLRTDEEADAALLKGLKAVERKTRGFRGKGLRLVR
ncbi:MAG: hypothetical protein ACLPJH_16935 [Myxococcaceae bacterium]